MMPRPALTTDAVPDTAAPSLLARLLNAGPPALVAVASLLPADSPRLGGVDAAHARTLAESVADLPPIFVRRSTMRIIDGMHRLDAARLRGDRQICVQFFDCTEDEAFMLAVATNVHHGRPLTLADRRAAATRIVAIRPEASDRWIAELTGLAAKTIAAIRRQSPGAAKVDRRVGRDGRARPVSTAEGRRMASALLAEQPDASLRQIASKAGISVGTARDVRQKIRQGMDPVRPRRIAPQSSTGLVNLSRVTPPVDYRPIVRRLRLDPSLRYTDSGRALLRWLSPPRLIDLTDLRHVIDVVPAHCRTDVTRIARACAQAWAEFAEELNGRCDDVPEDDEADDAIAAPGPRQGRSAIGG
jgi:ParB-like chromosome segregation protein Spo0J